MMLVLIMKKVLVAEDDRFLVNAYRIKLAGAGFEVKAGADGEEVLQIMKKWLPDVLLLDLIMPVMDGFKVLREMQRSAKWKKIPVIIASNLGQKQDIDRGMALGAKDYVVKSEVSLDEIIRRVNLLVPSV